MEYEEGDGNSKIVFKKSNITVTFITNTKRLGFMTNVQEIIS